MVRSGSSRASIGTQHRHSSLTRSVIPHQLFHQKRSSGGAVLTLLPLHLDAVTGFDSPQISTQYVDLLVAVIPKLDIILIPDGTTRNGSSFVDQIIGADPDYCPGHHNTCNNARYLSVADNLLRRGDPFHPE